MDMLYTCSESHTSFNRVRVRDGHTLYEDLLHAPAYSRLGLAQ
jgi:hypothetical protein